MGWEEKSTGIQKTAKKKTCCKYIRKKAILFWSYFDGISNNGLGSHFLYCSQGTMCLQHLLI